MELKRGDVVVWISKYSGKKEYFIVMDDCEAEASGERYCIIDGRAFGWCISSNMLYPASKGYTINRKATEKEIEWFFDWIREHGHYVNINTLEYRHF